MTNYHSMAELLDAIEGRDMPHDEGIDSDTGRRWPPGFQEFYHAASALHLDNAIGRALYACNRRQNGWPHGMQMSRLLTGCQDSTAARWLNHWNNGGSIKSLGRMAGLGTHQLIALQEKQREQAEAAVRPKEPPVRRAMNLTGLIG